MPIKAKLYPYVAVDLETTGLDLDRSQILQLAAVYDDGISPVSQLPAYVAWVNEPIKYFEIGALRLHGRSGFFDKLYQAHQDNRTKTLEEALDGFLDFIESHRTIRHSPPGQGVIYQVDRPQPKYRLALAGKNIASYDLPILQRWMNPIQQHRLNEAIYSSFLDVGPLYLPEFGRIVSLEEIKKYIYQQENYTAPSLVHHDAYEDSLDVIRAIRYKMGVSWGEK